MNSYTNSSNTSLLDLQRQRFEVLLKHPVNTAYDPGRIGALLENWGQTLVHWLTTGSMPKITKYAQGDTDVWKVYDPMSNRTLYFDHEDALRVWMDQRYYQ